jgi:adenylyltransferase/sulfurtransferase
MALTDEDLDRYARHLVLREIGGVGQAKIRAARVLLIGAGGLGSPAALYLAAAGVGTLGLVDDDAVSLSNLQRQILFRSKDVGRPKVEAGAEALKALNPGVEIDLHPMRLGSENAAGLIARYDIVGDGSDNFETRFLLNDACFAAKKPLVSAAVTEFEGQLATYKAFDRTGNYPCYRCLFPQPPAPGTMPNCSDTGVLGAAAGVMGALMALEILKEITGAGTGLAGKLLIYKALSAEFRTARLVPDPACTLCRPQP